MTKDALELLGGLSAEQFLSTYWQQKPLLIADAWPNYVAPLSADELAGLAMEAEVESRLVLTQQQQPHWVLQHGPFTAAQFSALPEKDWTLLVQAVDLWVPEVATLLARFDFLPRWRFDDVMISYATPGGSVGPHFDQYDVFLLQVEGQREWQIGAACDADTALLKGSQLSILQDFEAQQRWILRPGDMLYLPPGIAHWGIAQSPCMTFSIGFRAPSLADLIGDMAIELLAQGKAPHYRDPPLTPAMARAEIDPVFIMSVKQQLTALLEDDDVIADCFARFMTAPKYAGLESETDEQRRAVVGGHTYLNGERV